MRKIAVFDSISVVKISWFWGIPKALIRNEPYEGSGKLRHQ